MLDCTKHRLSKPAGETTSSPASGFAFGCLQLRLGPVPDRPSTGKMQGSKARIVAVYRLGGHLGRPPPLTNKCSHLERRTSWSMAVGQCTHSPHNPFGSAVSSLVLGRGLRHCRGGAPPARQNLLQKMDLRLPPPSGAQFDKGGFVLLESGGACKVDPF